MGTAHDAIEAQLVELTAAAEDLMRAYTEKLGAAVNELALATSRTNDHEIKTRERLDTLVRQQQQVLAEVREQWKLRLDGAAKAAGEAQADAFGQKIAAGLEKRLGELTGRVERVTRQFGWRTGLAIAGGLAGGLALVVAVALWVVTPRVPGLSALEVQLALRQLQPCEVAGRPHVCAEISMEAEALAGPRGERLVPLKGT
jgi:hypothetical protein